jgi:hypothetical protein
MTSTHTMLAYCPFGVGEIEVKICFTFRKGAPAQRPSYASGEQPADPDEIELVYAKATLHALDDFMACMLAEWAEVHLSEDGLTAALEQAASDYEAAREYAADLRADR